MNREIKFRAWDRQEKVMYRVLRLPLSWLVGGLLLHTLDAEEMTEDKNRDHYELMQFTGLKDAKGKEIYEGDIVRVGERSEIVGLLYRDEGVVTFSANVGAFSIEIAIGENESVIWPLQHFVLNQFEVIGNIYQNPELLKVVTKTNV
jgi:uncharacterized phage protein (TIGR01671 family)